LKASLFEALRAADFITKENHLAAAKIWIN
jgi:hypothetical protein